MLVRGARVVLEHKTDRERLAARRDDGFADVFAVDLREVLIVLLDEVGELLQRPSRFRRGPLAVPAVQPLARGCTLAVDVGLASQWHAGNRRAGGGVGDFERLAV